jgi:hypothetical protein
MFLLSKLPSAYFSGVRIRKVDERTCEVTVPYQWFSKNPFRSTYFASLAMAAEMSTGALAMAHLYRRHPPVSMLLVKLEAELFKKAIDRTSFTCDEGESIKKAIEEAVKTGETRIVRARTIGLNKGGKTVAEFFVTWSFKAKTLSP